MRLLGRLQFALWLSALMLFFGRHGRFTVEPVAGLANPRLSMTLDPTADLVALALCLLGTLTAGFVVLCSERYQASLKRLRQDVESIRSRVDRPSPPHELPRLKEAIRSGDLAGIRVNATWSALAFDDGQSLSPYELALIHGRADVLAILAKAYHEHGLGYRLVDWVD
jgi:hypothetical protein